MIEEPEFSTDEEYLKDLCGNLHDLIECCMESKEKIQDMDNWEVVHDLEFQLELAFESLRRYLAKMEFEEEFEE
jgi:hypothetical protein